MNVFSLLLADTVRVNAAGSPEILTKIAKDFVSVSYNINDKVCSEDYDVIDKNVYFFYLRPTAIRQSSRIFVFMDFHVHSIHSFLGPEITILFAIIIPKGR